MPADSVATTDRVPPEPVGPDPGRPGSGARGGSRRQETRLGLVLVVPALLLVLAVYAYPVVATLVFSVTDLDVGTYSLEGFVGLRNFAAVVGSEAFQLVTLRTLYFGFMVVVLTTVLAFFVALLLSKPFAGQTFMRVVVLLPWAVPPVVSGVLWTQMFQPEYGFINGMLRALGLPGDTIWLGNPNLALHALVVAEVWRWLPFASLFLLAGLQTVPRSLFEAAAVDGASRFQRLRLITVPIMAPIIVPVMLFLFVWAMKAFDTIFVLTSGGPRGGTTTLNYLVYQQGFQQFRFGRASATAYVLTLITLLVIAVLGVVRRRAQLHAGASG